MIYLQQYMFIVNMFIYFGQSLQRCTPHYINTHMLLGYAGYL